MSTRIFNGYEIAGRDPFAVLATVRDRLPDTARTVFHTWVAADVARDVDRARFGVPPLVPLTNFLRHEPSERVLEVLSGLVVRHEYLVREYVEHALSSPRRSMWDLSFDVTLYPHPRRQDVMLAMVFTERQELRDVFDAIPGVREYAYWNSTDRPEHVSAEQWDQRRADWDAALGGDTPATRGLTWSLLTTVDVYGLHASVQDVLGCLPEDRWRAMMLAEAMTPVLDSTVEKIQAAGGKGTFAIFSEDRRELHRVQSALADDLMDQLRPITAEDLTPSGSAPTAES